MYLYIFIILKTSVYRYCPANSKRGKYLAHIIRPSKLEARPFFFLNLKGIPSQVEDTPFLAAERFVRWLCLILNYL